MTPDRIKRAAEVMREWERVVRESNTRPWDFQWGDDLDAEQAENKAECDELLALAAELEALATR